MIADIFQNILPYLGTVSYTHLDVYKRQVLEIDKSEMNQEKILAYASGGVSENE